MHFLSSVISYLLSPNTEAKKHECMRLVITSIAGLALFGGYILGCFALYNYLLPELGNVLALASLGIVLLVTSLLLFLIGWSLKPKPTVLSLHPKLENALTHFISKGNTSLGESLPHHLPLIALVAGAGALSYFVGHAKKSVAQAIMKV